MVPGGGDSIEMDSSEMDSSEADPKDAGILGPLESVFQ
jgi:hypothetical protein